MLQIAATMGRAAGREMRRMAGFAEMSEGPHHLTHPPDPRD